ncbi:DUF2336 domain-containing protein [Arenibaculum pallidiluteum]|uniref:DUF2336 domain-containing protein n=1 Tax=Arenibaculum pallidiluteum TaxID=2812559 RepID=UPI001A97997B|nr:DUF2336 domain-containing protein [Arenibaculum pallidiluteum]
MEAVTSPQSLTPLGPTQPSQTSPSPTPPSLTKSDVDRLLAAPSAETRIETMRKLVGDLEAGTLAEGERSLAVEILHCFAADAEAAVREAVAWQIHNSPLLTVDLAERLARDVGRVAFPVLRHVEGLGDEFLLRVLAERDLGKQLAVAGRRSVSAKVSDALIGTDNVSVITCLLRNPGAEIAEPALHRALDRFGRLRSVSEAAALRPGLSLAVLERLVAYVSDGIRGALVRAHGLSRELVDRMVERGREAATMLVLRPVLRSNSDVDLVARWLQVNGRLTPTLLFRCLCAGDMDLFAAGLAERAGVSVENARLLVWDDGPLGLKAVLRHAGIPPVLVPPFRVAVAVAKEQGYGGGDHGREAYQAEVIARVFEECTPTDDWAVDDLLLQLFDQKSEGVIDCAMEQAGLPFAPVR